MNQKWSRKMTGWTNILFRRLSQVHNETPGQTEKPTLTKQSIG